MAVLLWLKNKLQHFLQIDLMYFIKGGFWISIENSISTFISFALGLVLINFLSQDDYGIYRFIFSITGILQIFLFNGMNSAVVQAVASGEEGALKKVVYFRLRWGSLFTAAAFVTSLYFLYHQNYIVVISLIILGVFQPINSAFGTYQSYLQGKKEFRLFTLSSLITQVILTLGIIFTLLTIKNIISLVLVQALIYLIVNFLFFWKTIKHFRPTNKYENNAISYGNKLTFLELFGILAQNLDKIVLFQFWGPAILANYAIAQFFPGYIYSLLKSTSGLLMPKISSQSISEISQSFYKRFFQSVFIGGVISSLYIMIAPFLFFIFFKKYSDMILYSQILSIDLIFALANSFVGSIFLVKKFIKSIYASQIISSLIRIILFITMGMIGGIMGMILASIISRFLGTILNIVLWELERRSFLFSNNK
ncbi:MAG: oligosaccharide flippase family protein [Patescibacteria group bacterium]